MANSQGFWSYVHADDEAEGGRISRLASDLASQFEMLTGESLALFLDKDAIKWGEEWRDKVDSSLANVAFFIPVMTPRYFMSPECRRELQFFARQSTLLGMKELVLPLLYVDVPSLHNETTADELIVLVRTFQWEDWRELRFLDTAAEGYRKGVARLAARLVEANRQAETTDITTIARQMESGATEGDDDSPGFLDRMAASEEAMPKLTTTLEAIGTDITLIGDIMKKATGEIQEVDKGGRSGFAARLLVSRKVALKLQEPAERIWSSGNEFVSRYHDIDLGIRAIVERARAEVEQQPESRTQICEFFNAVRVLSDAASGALASTQGMIDAIAPIENISKDLRPALRRLRQGLTRMVEAKEIGDEWIKLINASGITCEDQSIRVQ